MQSKNIAIQVKADSLNQKEFSDQTHIALRNVLETITQKSVDNTDLYGAIKQVRFNQFMVEINNEIQPFYLETLLKKTLYNQNIHESFSFAIYDCFTDSITYSPLYKFSKEISN